MECNIKGTHNISVLRGMRNNKVLLAVEGSNPESVIMFRANDGTGRMSWHIDEADGATDEYFIRLTKGVRDIDRYLSWKENSQEVFSSDTRGEFQKWKIEAVPGSLTCCTYHIKPAGKQEFYLNTDPDGKVYLLDNDENSGRQRWQLQGDWVTKYNV